MKDKGFTLVELLIVVAIMGVLLSSTLGMVQVYLLNVKVGATVEDLHQGLVRARVEAIKRNTEVKFTASSTCGFIMELPSMDARNAAEVVLKAEAEEALPRKVVTATSVLVTNGTDIVNPLVISFSGTGRPKDNAEIIYSVQPVGMSCKTADGTGDINCKTVQVSSGGQIKICNPIAANLQYRC